MQKIETEMQSKSLQGSKPSVATQKYLDVAEVRDGIIVLRDGGLRQVIAVSSTNFALKSEEEQNAITAAYQGFLNSLDFPIQIRISSRVLDIDGYLEKLKGLMATQSNELLRIQMAEYIEYVGKLVEFASIMSKTFYVVVPYSTGKPVKQTLMTRIKRIFSPTASIVAGQESFEKGRAKLEERVQHVVSELGSMGLRSIVLTTEELIELLYNAYNFESASPLHADALEEIDLEVTHKES